MSHATDTLVDVVGSDPQDRLTWSAPFEALRTGARFVSRGRTITEGDVVRVNLVSAGPIETLAAGGIPGFDQLAANWHAVALLQWDVNDSGPVAAAVCFLLSDHARAITGEILHVDGGYHAMGAPIR